MTCGFQWPDATSQDRRGPRRNHGATRRRKRFNKKLVNGVTILPFRVHTATTERRNFRSITCLALREWTVSAALMARARTLRVISQNRTTSTRINLLFRHLLYLRCLVSRWRMGNNFLIINRGLVTTRETRVSNYHCENIPRWIVKIAL